ncbi:Sporulation related domain-containing protein [Fontimonas thermophila]|uniref:Sporulation related domain-containing protein n=1 Tax=Fontimonas thermophila TaxID=1076937 RepID=A0A1I2H9I4_9GAMM|nr:SPOR domain-containing protein [Fontimonas thermophila]SFF26033.1 Sporulation related domain-containing protein [Fontimonas thermophila]
MARDYAQRNGGRRRTRSTGGLPGWVWLVVGLSAGLAVAAFVYVSRPVAPPSPPLAAQTAPAEKKTGTSGPIPLPPKEKPRFTFYEILKNQEVVIPGETARAPTPPPAAQAAGEGSYIIQVASFRSQAEAERQKAALALIGIESRIETVTIDGRDTYYRVRIGPESSWGRVQSTLARLDENGIDAMVIRLR